VAFVVYTIAGKVWPMEEKFEEGHLMEGLYMSSVSNSDQDDGKVRMQHTSKEV